MKPVIVLAFANDKDNYLPMVVREVGLNAYAHQDGLVSFLEWRKGLTFVFLTAVPPRNMWFN